MFWRRGRHAARQDSRVCLLGNEHLGADRSIGWDGDIGNLGGPDVLIVDLTTLARPVLQRIDKTGLDRAQKSTREMLLGGGTIVVITQPEFSTLSNRPLAGRPPSPFGGATVDPYRYSNYHTLPANIITTTVPAGTEIRARGGHYFREYISAVKGYRFLISVGGDEILPGQAGERRACLHRMPEWDITGGCGHILGLALAVLKPDNDGRPRQPPCSGRLVLLPPPTEPIDEAIGRILSVYKGDPPYGRADAG